MKTSHKLLATVIAAQLSTSAMAALDGSLDSTSEGRIDLDLEVLNSVQITALDDQDFGTYGCTDTGGINAGDTSNTGNRRIGFSFSHRDILDGGAFEILGEDSMTRMPMQEVLETVYRTQITRKYVLILMLMNWMPRSRVLTPGHFN